MSWVAGYASTSITMIQYGQPPSLLAYPLRGGSSTVLPDSTSLRNLGNSGEYEVHSPVGRGGDSRVSNLAPSADSKMHRHGRTDEVLDGPPRRTVVRVAGEFAWRRVAALESSQLLRYKWKVAVPVPLFDRRLNGVVQAVQRNGPIGLREILQNADLKPGTDPVAELRIAIRPNVDFLRLDRVSPPAPAASTYVPLPIESSLSLVISACLIDPQSWRLAPHSSSKRVGVRERLLRRLGSQASGKG